jgi:hypothetical protein
VARKEKKKKLKIDMDISILDSMIYYIYSNNGNASKKTLVKMKELMGLLDEEVFEADRPLEVRAYIINRALEGKLDRRISDERLLSTFVLGGGGEFDDEAREFFFEMDDIPDLGDDEVYFVDDFISDRLQYGYLFQYEDELDSNLQTLRAGDFHTLGDLNTKFKETISGLYNHMKKAESQSRFASRDFGTDGLRLDCALSQTISNLQQSRNRIKTGIKWLNSMLRGGFQCARVYTFVGVLKGLALGSMYDIQHT